MFAPCPRSFLLTRFVQIGTSNPAEVRSLSINNEASLVSVRMVFQNLQDLSVTNCPQLDSIDMTDAVPVAGYAVTLDNTRALPIVSSPLLASKSCLPACA